MTVPKPPSDSQLELYMMLARGSVIAVLFGLFGYAMFELRKIEQAAQHAETERLLTIIENWVERCRKPSGAAE